MSKCRHGVDTAQPCLWCEVKTAFAKGRRSLPLLYKTPTRRSVKEFLDSSKFGFNDVVLSADELSSLESLMSNAVAAIQADRITAVAKEL